MSRVATFAALALISVALIACGGSTSSPAAPSAPAASIAVAATAAASATAAPTATVRPTPRATPVPTPEPTPLDPKLLRAAFTATFWKGMESVYKGEISEALERSSVAVETVDRVRYDADTNTIRFDVSNGFGDYYGRHHPEWREDTWEVFRDYGRDTWAEVEGGFGDEISGHPIDWLEMTPSVVLWAEGGKVRATCPGSIIHKIAERDATQEDFEGTCKFKYS